MEDVRISVIVPVYGAENTLGDCVDSILAQDCPGLEVILVDDGSPDGCPALCDAYAEKNPAVRAIHQRNAGVSAARNAGIAAARGEYIAFADADDLLEPGILARALAAAGDGLMPVWGYAVFGGGPEECCPELAAPEMTAAGKAAALIGHPPAGARLGQYFSAVWGKLFSAEIIDRAGIRFPEDQYIGEDMIFLLDYVPHIARFVPVSCGGYRYRRSSSSAVARYKPDLPRQTALQAERILSRVDADAPETRTALAGFCYDMFCALVLNAEKASAPEARRGDSAARQWLKTYGTLLKRKGVDASRMRKLYRIQYRTGVFLPYGVQAYLVRKLGKTAGDGNSRGTAV